MHNKYTWQEYYNESQKYFNEHHNLKIPYNYIVGQMKLGVWLNNQRQAYKQKNGKSITQEHIDMLNKIGMIWEINNMNELKIDWYTYYELLKLYKETYGDTLVPARYVLFYEYKEQGELKSGIVKLGQFVRLQRQGKKGINNKKISPEKIKLLEEIGMIWDVAEYKQYIKALKSGLLSFSMQSAFKKK